MPSSFSILLLSLSILLGAHAIADESPAVVAERASVLISQNRGDEALLALEKIPADAEAQPWAIGEATKQLYRKQHWSRFFGLASFTRMHYPLSETRDEIQLLEILALLRHCQKDHAVNLVRQGLSESSSAAKPRYEMLASLLEVAATAPDEELTKENSQNSDRKVFRSKNLWPIPAKSAQNLDPWKMARKVEPQCAKEGVK